MSNKQPGSLLIVVEDLPIDLETTALVVTPGTEPTVANLLLKLAAAPTISNFTEDPSCPTLRMTYNEVQHTQTTQACVRCLAKNLEKKVAVRVTGCMRFNSAQFSNPTDNQT